MWPFADSKLVDVTTVGEVDAEEHDHNSLVKILKPKFSQDIEAKFQSWSLIEISKFCVRTFDMTWKQLLW